MLKSLENKSFWLKKAEKLKSYICGNLVIYIYRRPIYTLIYTPLNTIKIFIGSIMGEQSNQLFVGNLNYTATDDDIYRIFEKYGAIEQGKYYFEVSACTNANCEI